MVARESIQHCQVTYHMRINTTDVVKVRLTMVSSIRWDYKSLLASHGKSTQILSVHAPVASYTSLWQNTVTSSFWILECENVDRPVDISYRKAKYQLKIEP